MGTGDMGGIGQRVRAVRERAEMSREALAFRSGISWSAIAQIESGRRRNLRPTTLAAIAEVLGVTVDYLLTGRSSSRAMFEHHALLYDTDEAFLATAAPFLADAVDRSEAALVVTDRPRMGALRQLLGSGARRVEFVDLELWPGTPAGTLAAYRDFLERAIAGGAAWVRILGHESVSASRSKAEVRVWARCESLLNVELRSSPVTMLCPCDKRGIAAHVVGHVRATHPHIVEDGILAPSEQYADPSAFVLEH
jgi:transcriptional regulator with XRE-family HTH domain